MTATAAGIATAGLGHLFGLPLDAMLFGLFGGLVAILLMPSKGTTLGLVAATAALIAQVVSAVLAASALGPISAAYLHVNDVAESMELRACSFLWGAGVTVLLPTAIDAFRNRIRQAGGLPEGDPR